ncbi:cryptochrome/photolyase family protein [Cytobacillus sp. FJAT-54145]|uniref:Cryptochrome/photolyase family protein n=1 Tax=Cytobacillus spartinae TaxID=3299023 RepID=A0ABW6K8W4_9BACI
MQKTIVWFRKDLRLHDHQALWEASQNGSVIPIFIWPHEEHHLLSGEASLWWLHHSLLALQEEFKEHYGVDLIIRKGNSLDILIEVMEDTGANALYFNERYEPFAIKRDHYVIESLNKIGVDIRTFHSNLLYNPFTIANLSGDPYKVFTPFWKRCLNESISRPLPRPSLLNGIDKVVSTIEVAELGLLPTIRWDEKLHCYWQPGEKGAISVWELFIQKDLHSYKTGRDYPSLQAGSRLSPHLAWGEISPRAMWYSLEMEQSHIPMNEQIEAYKRQLIWREFGYYQLVHFPTISKAPLRPAFEHFPWDENQDNLLKWQKGETGYPLVDAGMRELWETGTMHNRVRMVVASFLVKHLLIPWTYGAKWFQHTLVDFDLANNSMGWQWVTGSGLDSAPYFRIFNPITQGEKFDRDGEYIRKWVPELTKLPNPYIHRPWTAPSELLKSVGIKLNETYPLPIIDHDFARKRALAAYDKIK